MNMRCNKCHRPMKGSTSYDGACECGGLIELTPLTKAEAFEAMLAATNAEAYIEAYQAHYLACNELERRLIVLEHTNGPEAAAERSRIERELRTR